ncbi:ATP-binding cassette domain-containing protein [Hippea maritima]|uniref:ABC transporter related protein n=1 Tax=Hippea maritima (strain ATCC 700847 / DSM 10411 / MH2) TaxID=760142 RepID=F2LUS4_HIPMA|nr:ABC transporter ATP-binding protein [Hippea maritima]AEA33529.1 ABC transporter related protein [Hippea maritima DSM 10411]
MLKLENIKYSKNSNEIIKGINMEFEEGKIYGIVGNNGVGKSTIGYIIMGLSDYKPNDGRILLDGEDITQLDVTQRAKKGISLLWQEPARFEGITVENYLKLNRKIPREQIEEALEFVNLEPNKYLKRFVDKKLSGGERKKVELASCLLLKPRYLIMDEPDSGIDIMSLDMIIKVINRFKEMGSAVIVITHRKEIALSCSYSYLICAGKVFLEGTSDKIVEYYEKTCDTCGHINYLEED